MERKLYFIALGPGTPHCRSFALIKHPELEGIRVGNEAGVSAEGIYLSYYLSFSYTSYRRIATHLGKTGHIHGYQEDLGTEPRSCSRGFTSGMTSANNDYVVLPEHLNLFKHGKIVILLCPHRFLIFFAVIVITDKMQEAVDYYPVQFFFKG